MTLDVNKVYPVNKSYICDSVYSEEQQKNFLRVLKESFDLLVNLCTDNTFCYKLSHEVKQIVYLAEDILKVAMTIPSAINQNEVIDMRCQVCGVVHELACNAPKVEIGLPVNIESQVSTIREHYGYCGV